MLEPDSELDQATIGCPPEAGGKAKGRRAERVGERGWGPASTRC